MEERRTDSEVQVNQEDQEGNPESDRGIGLVSIADTVAPNSAESVTLPGQSAPTPIVVPRVVPATPPKSSVWTSKEDYVLRDLHGLGASYSLIARRVSDLGRFVTRNACIGRAARLKLEKRGAMPGNRKDRKDTIKADRTTPFVVRKYLEQPSQSSDIAMPESLRIPIYDLEWFHCRAITDTEGSIAFYCGHHKCETNSFCPSHSRLYYTTPPKRSGSSGIFRFQ